MTSEPWSGDAAASAIAAAPREQRLSALAISVLLHIVLLSVGAIASVAAARTPHRHFLPLEPLQIVAVGLVLAHLSVGAMSWARTSGSIHARTVIAALAALGMWGLLLLLLDHTRASGVASAAWAAAFTVQVLLAAAATLGIEFFVDPRAAAARSRFSISFVLLWTSLLALVLGGVGSWSSARGWKLADVAHWQFFLQLQLAAVLSATMAATVHGSLRLVSHALWRIAGCTVAVLAAGAVSPLLFRWLFGDEAGATSADIAWLFAGQGLFLVASLAPHACFVSPPHNSK